MRQRMGSNPALYLRCQAVWYCEQSPDSRSSLTESQHPISKMTAPGEGSRKSIAIHTSQDEASCVVYGMPREAVAAGAVHESAPLAQLPAKVLGQLAREGGRALRV